MPKLLGSVVCLPQMVSLRGKAKTDAAVWTSSSPAKWTLHPRAQSKGGRWNTGHCGQENNCDLYLSQYEHRKRPPTTTAGHFLSSVILVFEEADGTFLKIAVGDKQDLVSSVICRFPPILIGVP